MEKSKLFKRLTAIGLSCLSVGLLLKFVVDIHGNKPDFFIGLLIGAGITLMIVSYIKEKSIKSHKL